MIGTTFQISCWAFRSLSQQSLRASLISFESIARAGSRTTSYTQTAMYRQLASSNNQLATSQTLPHSLLIHHFDDLTTTSPTNSYSQELLQEHSSSKQSSRMSGSPHTNDVSSREVVISPFSRPATCFHQFCLDRRCTINVRVRKYNTMI